MGLERHSLIGIASVVPMVALAGCAEKVPESVRVAQLEEMIRTKSLPEAPTAIVRHGFEMFRAPDGPCPGDPEVELTQVTIGELHVPSGKLCVCDPSFVASAGVPFVRTAPTGTFPVVLTLARFVKQDDERVALSAVLFGSAPVARWEIAVHTRTNPKKPLNCAFGVDSGMACCFDYAGREGIAAFMKDSDRYKDMLTKLEATYRHTRNWTVVEVDAPTRANVAVFSSGVGDGSYESCWALDAQDRPVALVTHFGLLGENDDA
jgi:hypothetical protein